MNTHVGILVAMLASSPLRLAGQELDSLRAHELVIEMAQDVRRLDHLSDLQFIRRSLPAIGTFFGIEFELPPNQGPVQGRGRAHLDVVYRELGTESLLDEAVRLNEERGRDWWTPLALEMIARREGPDVALRAARERGLLEPGFDHLLNGVGLRRLDDVLIWIAGNDIEPELRAQLRARTFLFGSHYEPYRFWRRADSLPEPYRTRVRTRALTSIASSDTIPSDVLEAELRGVVVGSAALEPRESRAVLQVVAFTCARRKLDTCDDLDLPDLPLMTGDNLPSIGTSWQATNRLEQVRRAAPPLAVARWMAQGLESLGSNCRMEVCDLVRIDSLATEWLGEILSTEADALAGRIERSGTWNGDDLPELQRALGAYLHTRDLDALRALLGRTVDAETTRRILHGLIQEAPEIDLVGAVQIYLDYAPDGSEPLQIYYSDLIRAGRPDLAEAMLRKASPGAATRARIEWVQRLTHAGRAEEARAAVRTLMSESSYPYPAGGAQLLDALQSLRMLDEYLAHLRAQPTPLERLNGLVPIISAWVQEEQSARR